MDNNLLKRRRVMQYTGPVRSITFMNDGSHPNDAIAIIEIPCVLNSDDTLRIEATFEFINNGVNGVVCDQRYVINTLGTNRYIIINRVNYDSETYQRNTKKYVAFANGRVAYINTPVDAFGSVHNAILTKKGLTLDGVFYRGGRIGFTATNRVRFGQRGGVRLFSCKIENDGITLVDVIPYVKNGIAGLYNKVDGLFYSNSGIGQLNDIVADYEPLS